MLTYKFLSFLFNNKTNEDPFLKSYNPLHIKYLQRDSL